jgi:hypothetical protein
MSVFSGPADWWTDGTNDGRYHVDTKGIVQTGLIYHIDAAVTQSYPGSGTTWTDLTSNPLNATINNGTFSSDSGGAFTTSNTATLATIGNLPVSSKLSLTQNFSIEQTFKPTGYQASTYFGLTNQLLAKGTASTYNYVIQLSSDTTVSFIKRTSPEGLQYHTFAVPSMLNRVIVLTFVVSSNTTVLCYMNGILIGSLSIVGAAIAAVEGDPTYISVDLTGNDEGVLKGNYYNCKVYNIALSAAQITQNFNALRGRFGI